MKPLVGVIRLTSREWFLLRLLPSFGLVEYGKEIASFRGEIR